MSSILDEVARLQIAAEGGREAARRLGEVEMELSGLRAGLLGEPVPETTCDAIERGREEGARVRQAILIEGGTEMKAWFAAYVAAIQGKPDPGEPLQYRCGRNDREAVLAPEKKAIVTELARLGISHNPASSPCGLASHLVEEVERLRADNLVGENNGLREERADHRASALRIRTLLAPLLGVDVNNEPADEMVGRFVKLYGARDERTAEQRGHDKAMEWAAVLAGDFDPFSEDWTDEQRGAGERVLGLFAERLRDEVGGGVTAWETTTLPESPSEATSWGVAVVDDQPAPPPSRPSSSPAGFYRVYDSNQTDAEAALYVKVTKAGEVWGYSEFEGVPGYRTLGRPWVSFATEPGNERMRWMPDRDRVAEQESLRAWNPPLVPAPSLDGGLTNEEVAAVRALLKREGE